MDTEKKETEVVAKVPLGTFLLDQLFAHGAKHIFGIPGDYVIRFNKMIEEHPVELINATRESTAGYLADGYARMKGIGVACITYGVGMNITNACAQAYAESSPIIIISGAASDEEFRRHRTLHHLINKCYTSYRDNSQMELFKQVTAEQALLDDPTTAPQEIDRVLKVCLLKKKPVYIELPRDRVDALVEMVSFAPPKRIKSNLHAIEDVLEAATQVLQDAKQPILWIGREILTHNLSGVVLEFAEKFQIPIVSTLLGKTAIDEYHPLFLGVFQGKMSRKEVLKHVSSCDCAITLGLIQSDVDTGFFTETLTQERQIFANPGEVNIAHRRYPQVRFVDFIEALPQLDGPTYQTKLTPNTARLDEFKPRKEKITTERFFHCLQKHLLPNHIITTDIGDSLFACSDLILGQHAFISCAYFAAMGFAVPAAVAASIACPQRRVIAIVGDGAFQMTATELSTAVRYGLDPIIIILNNHGYGTERLLLEGEFNEILNWNYSAFPQLLNGGKGAYIQTEEEADSLLKEALKERGQMWVLEVELGKTDFSSALHRFKELAKEQV